MRYLFLLFLACSSEKSEQISCAFVCGATQCYVPVAQSCGDKGYVIDHEESHMGSGPLCTITYHCR